jgi:Uma2 family endonuclease
MKSASRFGLPRARAARTTTTMHTRTMLQQQAKEGPYTWDDFVALEDEDRRELIDGELVEVEVPTGAHERITFLIGHWLESWAEREGGGMTLGSGYKVRISNKRGVMPDVQFFRTGNHPRGQQQGLVEGHPDLAVEVSSPSSVRYDRVKKLAWYASIGVPEYWIVDPALKSFHRLVLTGDRYVIADAVDGDVIVRPPSFDGLELPLAKLWAAYEELGG